MDAVDKQVLSAWDDESGKVDGGLPSLAVPLILGIEMRLTAIKCLECIRPGFGALMLLLILGSGCSLQWDMKTTPPAMPPQPVLEADQYRSFDGDVFGCRSWVPAKQEPTTVLIGVHGISGHAGDYDNLGRFLLKHRPGTALYAAETRGQGMDPELGRRGDIISPEEWYRDLHTFSGLVQKRHPKAKVVWFGESMGALIVMHAYAAVPEGQNKPDALVLASPIVDIASKLPVWKYRLARTLAVMFPKFRISLESLSGVQHAVVTEDDIHAEQAAKNPWYIKRYTLRLLLHLGRMSEALPVQVREADCPVLLLHGGKDLFTSEESVKRLEADAGGKDGLSRKFYPDSYHLLLYDHQRERIFKDVVGWLNKR